MASTVSSGIIFFFSTGALLITLFPQVDGDLRICHFDNECALRPNSKGIPHKVLQLNDMQDKAELMEKCCTELQGATFFFDGCNPCKLPIP